MFCWLFLVFSLINLQKILTGVLCLNSNKNQKKVINCLNEFNSFFTDDFIDIKLCSIRGKKDFNE